jgi:hypothetical protein
MKRVRLCSTSAAPGGANPQRLWWNHNTPEAIWWWVPLVLTMIPMTENSEVVNIYLDIFEYINIYLCIYIYIIVYIYLYVYIYMYIYIHMKIPINRIVSHLTWIWWLWRSYRMGYHSSV